MHCIAATKKEIRKLPAKATPNHETISALAYDFWVSRGRPDGSPDVDWHRAEAELRKIPTDIPFGQKPDCERRLAKNSWQARYGQRVRVCVSGPLSHSNPQLPLPRLLSGS
jgi:Protein of unknown function (DUF2934)